MAKNSDETGKITRTSLESLVIFVTNDELKYRHKYLPDPRRLSDDKIVCTVCSTSLASRVRKGKEIYIHAILGVLMCKKCHNFYGDGVFSTDEDGDDKYCRWCGQGGTLYLCSKCNCGFCKKCMTKNMKNSALADIDNDDWKCLICVPRPIFGSRAVCWASQDLNSAVRKNELVKERLEKEKLKIEEEKKTEKRSQSKEQSRSSSVNREKRTNKRVHTSEDSDSSTVFIPAKKLKRDAKSNKSLNGSVKKHRRKDLSSDIESSDSTCSSRVEKRNTKSKNKRESSSSGCDTIYRSKVEKRKTKTKHKRSCSSSDSDNGRSSKKEERKTKSHNKRETSISESDNNLNVKEKQRKFKNRNKLELSSSEDGLTKSSKKRGNKSSLKNIPKKSSDESSDSDETNEKSRLSRKEGIKSFKTKRKNKVPKRKKESTSDSSTSEYKEKSGKKKKRHSKQKSSSDASSGDENNLKENQETSFIETSDNPQENSYNMDASNKKVKGTMSKFDSVSCLESEIYENNSENTSLLEKNNPSLEKSELEDCCEKLTDVKPGNGSSVQENTELKTVENANELEVNESLSLGQETSLLDENDYTLSYNGSSSYSDDKLNISQEDEVKVKVDLAIEWLAGVASDIGNLGSFIAERSTRFGERKVNLENLHSYDDVSTTLYKIKQLLGGIHSNYKLIDEDLEDKFKSWKILVGLEKPDLEDDEEGEIEAEDVAPLDENVEIETDGMLTHVDGKESMLPCEDQQSVEIKVETELCSEVDTALLRENEELSSEPLTNETEENNVKDNENEDVVIKEEVLDTAKTENKTDDESKLVEGSEMPKEAVEGNETSHAQEPNNEEIDVLNNAKLQFRLGSSNLIWKGLLSSDDESYFNEDMVINLNVSGSENDDKNSTDEIKRDLVSEAQEGNGDSLIEDQGTKGETGKSNEDSDLCETEKVSKELVDEKDAENFKALQELLGSSTEPDTGSSDSDSDGSSDELNIDDSDLENILKPRKTIIKKSTKKKEKKVIEDINEELENEVEKKVEKEDAEEKCQEKVEDPLDSEAEIDMLTDLSKLKKKTVLRRFEKEDSSDEGSSEASQDNEQGENRKKRKKYDTKSKEKREQERNELLGFLKGDSSADEEDITKEDLDVMEDNYASNSSDSQAFSLEAFSRKMNEKWRELEKEQDQLNLQLLLASESGEGSDGGDALVLDSDKEKSKKKDKKSKVDKTNEVVDEASEEKNDTEDDDMEKGDVEEAKVKEEKEEEKAENEQDYEQFLDALTKTKTTFMGLGSSSEEDEDKEEIDIKEELLSDRDTKVKKEAQDSDNEDERSSNSDSSADLFLDRKKKSDKKATWREHKLLRIKLSDTDTSDEERWWQRRLEREKKKKEEGDSSKKPREKKKKEENGSDKENKKAKREKCKKQEEDNSSSTLEISSSDSSGSEVFKKKKKNKSSDSDIEILSDGGKKKKKKKKRMNLSGDSSDESGDSDDDVIDITQKSSQGESPGKGGRKNIRKVLTKHELAAATKAAAKEEEERKKRIAARQKLFNEMFEIKEAEILQKLVLDFDPETKTELISVDKDLVTKMKPHQAKGVKFMWDSCFESLNQMKTKKGSGCILAHCMGLGKTFQVVSLVHTILTHKDTNVHTVLVVCPLSTVLNWYNEFDKWLEGVAGGRNIKIYHLTKFKKAHERSKQLSLWHRTGGVMVLGYEMFRILANPNNKKFRLMHTEVFQKTLIDPGADLVVCDEGHMLKNESTLLSKAMSRIRTLRRIVLTGTPMQNNLKEYHCMVQFVKPNLLGTRKEFLNQFVNPITNGQFVDSTEADVKVMKRRSHVLHKMLEGLVQRFDYSVLTPFLPPKQEYVISLKLSDVQVKLYQFYLDYFCERTSDDKRTSSQLFQDWQVLGRIWTHPLVLKMGTDKAEKERQETIESEEELRSTKLRSQKPITDFFKKTYGSSSSDSSKNESEDEGSIEIINDKSSSSSLSVSPSSSDDESGEMKDKTNKKKNRDSKGSKEPEKTEEILVNGVPPVQPVDEINLISSEEEDGDKNEEVEEIKDSQSNDENNENENKANDSGIEEQDEKNDEPNSAEEKTVESDIEAKKESKEEDKQITESEIEDQKESSEGRSEEVDKEESKEDDKQESKDEKKEKSKKKAEIEKLGRRGAWWRDIIEPHHLEDINQSSKLTILFAILRECELIEDKVLVFSQSLFSLDLIELFLKKVDKATEDNQLDESLGNHAGCWQKGIDYFRLDGSSSSESRSSWCKSFNREDNPRARLFLISTRAGGLGINLTGANRVIIFDASWNPSHDIQSIFRIYRFGQKKPCYVYRFVAHGTMEEKVYERQVAKQLLSSRVVDEQQVHRHFSMSDLNELYTFTPPQDETDKPTPVLPKDRLMAELLTQYNNLIEKYHEHDSLLENIAEEELNEEERQLAWEDYENEKKREFIPQAPVPGAPNYSMMAIQYEQFSKSLRLKFPNATEAEMNSMLQTLIYQVSYNNTLSPQQQQQAQQRQQVNPGTSQQQPLLRTLISSTSTVSPQFSQMVQKMQSQLQQRSMNQQQRVGANQMNQQSLGNRPVNQQMVGNGQIRKTHQKANESFREQMRTQQQANLARIQNQRKLQQSMNPGQQPIPQRDVVRIRPVNNRGQSTFNSQTLPQPIRTQQPNLWKSNQPLPNRTVQSTMTSNRLQQMQNRRDNAVNVLNRRQLQVPQPNNRYPQQTHTKNLQQTQLKNQQQLRLNNRQQIPLNNQRQNQPRNPQQTQLKNQQQIQLNNRQQIPFNNQRQTQLKTLQQTQLQKPQQTQLKTPQQRQLEQMRQRIEQMKQLKKQENLQQNKQLEQTGSLSSAQQRQLEEMKKRYNATRMKQMSATSSKPINIVEIDDEPGT